MAEPHFDELIRIAGRLANRQALPSCHAEDWPKRPSGKAVAERMLITHAWLGEEARNIRKVAERVYVLERELENLRSELRHAWAETEAREATGD